MQNEFTKPEFMAVSRDPTVKPPEDTNDRDVGTFLEDEAIGLAKPVVGLGRTITQAARIGVDAIPKDYRPDWLGDGAHGPVAEADRWMGRREQDLEDARSARDKALDTVSPFPGADDRSFWKEPVASTIHAATPFVIPALAAVATGGASLAGQVAMGTLFGTLGVGGDLSKLRDAADNLPLDQLKKLPQWQEFGGDAEAARNQLFKDTVDIKTEAVTFGVNALTFGAFLNGLGSPAKKALAARMKNMLIEGGSGTALGAGQGAVGSYSEQLGKVRRGEQENIDPAAMSAETKRGATFGAPMALYGLAAPPHLGGKEATPWKPPPGYDEYGNKIPDGGGPPAGYDEYGNPTSTPPPPPGAPPPGGPGTGYDPYGNRLPGAPTTGYDEYGNAVTAPPPTTPGGPAPLDTDVKSVATQALKTDAPTPPPMQPQNIFAPPLPNNKPGISETPRPSPSGPAGPSPALPPQVSQGEGPPPQATAAPPPSSPPAVPRGPAPAEATAAPVAPVPSPVARTEPAAGTAPVRTPPVQPTAPEHIVPPQEGAPHGGVTLDGVMAGMTPEDAATVKQLLDMGTHKGNASSVDEQRLQAILAKYGLGMPIEKPPVAERPTTPSPDWVEHNVDAIRQTADRLGLTPRIKELAERGDMTAKEISQALGGQMSAADVRTVRSSLGIEGIGGPGNIGRTETPPPPPIAGKDARFVGRNFRDEPIWERPDGKRYTLTADGMTRVETPLVDHAGNIPEDHLRHRRNEFWAVGENREGQPARGEVPQGGGEPVDTVSTPPSDEAQAASDRSFEQLQSANLVDERLQRDGKLFINSGPEGYTAHEGGMQAKLKLDPNPAERKAAKRAEANADLADTPEERIAAGEELKTALRPAVERAIKEQQTPTVTPGVKPLPDTSLGARLAPDQQQHMRDQATAAETSRKAAVETALQAEHERNAKVAALQNVGTPPRTGKVKTGVERALEASIKAWKASETKTPEAWVALRKRAMQADYLRREGGLEPKYVKQLGEGPGGPEPRISPEMEQRFGQKREVPSLQGEKPTPAEAKLIAGIEKLRADMQPPTPDLETQNAPRAKNVPPPSALTPQQYARRIRPLLAEAQRLDAGRHAAGKPAMFEKALPHPPGERRTPEQQFNEAVHTLNLYRARPPDEFIRLEPVRDALNYMANIQLPMIPPEWVTTKLAQGSMSLVPERHIQSYLQELKRNPGGNVRTLGGARAAQTEARQQAAKVDRLPTPLERHVVQYEERQRGAPQKIEHTGAFPMSSTEILTHRQFETEQEPLRRERAHDQPEGQRLRAQADAEAKAAEARRKTPEAAYAGGLERIQREKEARAAAEARGEQGTTPEADRRMKGELPTPEKWKAMVDAFFGTAKSRSTQRDRTTQTRATQFVDRDWAVGQSIREVLQKHFGEDYGKIDTLLDRLQIGPKPTLPKVLKETPKGRGSRGALEAHAAARKLYTAELKFWRDKQQANMLKASVELSGVIKEVEALAKEYIETQRGISTSRGGSIHWDLPTGEEQPGTPYTRYKIGVSTEKSDMFNMLADMMTARNHIDVGMDVLRGRDNELSLDRVFETGDQRTIDRVSRDVSNWVNRLASDWRNYKNNDLAAIREERSVRNQPIEEQKRAAQQKKLEGGEEGETGLSDEVRPLDEPETPEEAAIRREEEAGLAPKHIETRYEEAQRLTRERKGFEAMMAVEKSDAHLTTEQSQRAAELRTEIAQLLGKTEYPVPEKTGRIKRTPNFEHEGKASEGKVLKGQALARAIKARGGATEPIGRRITTEERLAQIKDELDQLGVTKVLDPETGKMREATQAETDAEVDKVKKNRRNRLQDGPAPETAPQYMAEVHSARDALTDANPQHPLISDPEPASASIERAKDIVKRGEAADVSDFITPEFLDKLSKANDGVAVVHAPLEVVRGERNEGQAFYQPNHDRIVLSNDVSSGDYVKNVVHEQVHAATEHLLVNDPEFRGEVEDLRQTAERAARRAGVTSERLRYGLTDVHEFLSESQSNPEFRALLQRSAAPGKAVIHGAKTVMNALYATIQKAWRKLAGVKDGDTALDVLFRDTSSVLGATDRLVQKTLDRLAVEGRTPGSDLADRRFRPNIGDIARKSRESLSDTVHSNALQDIVMGLHTTWDFTHRGTAEWQKLSKRIAESMSTTATERGTIAADNNVRMRDTAKWLNALGDSTRFEVEKFLHDETMHSAFADAPLIEKDAKDKRIGKNKHISETALADAQARRLHDRPGAVDKEGKSVGMRQRFDDLVARVPHFAEHRAALHKFFTDIENNVRDAVSKALIEHLRILPESADTPEKKAAAVDLIQKHVLGEKLTKGEKDTLEAIKGEVGRKNFRDIVSRIRRTPELTRIAGPYIPLTRHGTFAVSGHFNMPEGGRNGERLANTKDREGRPVDDGIRMFDNRADAEAFEQRMYDKFGISQTDGGEWFIDKRTGKRAREYTEEEMKMWHDGLDPDMHNRLLKAKEVEPGIVEEGPNQYEKKYWVKMQPQLLEFHDRKSEAAKSTAAWRKLHGDDIAISDPEPVHRGLGKQNEKYASAQNQKLIDRIETAPSFTSLEKDQQAALITALTLQSAKLSLRRGVRQSFKPRGYVQGFDPHDLVRNMENYSGQTAGYLANTKGYVERMAARKALDDYMHDTRHDGLPEHTMMVRMKDELYRKMDEPAENTHETLLDRGTNVLTKWSLLKNLPGFSYFTANATEVAVLGAPNMMDRHGPGEVAGAIHQGYRIFGGKFAPFKAMARGLVDAYHTGRGQSELNTQWKDYVDKAISNRAPPDMRAGMKQFFERIHRIGLMEPTTGIEYQKSLYNPSASRLERASDWAANVFQAANAAIENLNRFVTGGASYMLEMRRQMREGKSREDAQRAAEDYAIDIMYRTNGDARDWNKPSVFNKGPVMRLSTQYKSFPQRVMATFIDSGVAALKLTTAEGRANPENWEKGRRLAALTAVTIGAAGMLGLPTEILKAPLNVLYMLGLSNWNSDDAEAHFRQWTATKFGAVGRVAADGFSALTPFDFQSKLSQSNTFFYGAPKSTKSTDLMAAAFGVIAGAGGHTAIQAKDGINDLVKGTQMIMDGATSQGWLTVQKGLREVLPVKLLADAMSMGDSLEPRTTPGGKVTRQPLTTVETIGQMMGFQPQRISEERFTKDTVKGLTDRFNAERSRLIQEWVQASPTQRVMIQRTIDEFNKRYPDAHQRITRDNMMKAQEAHKKALAAPLSDLGLSLSARTRPFLRDQPVYR